MRVSNRGRDQRQARIDLFSCAAKVTNGATSDLSIALFERCSTTRLGSGPPFQARAEDEGAWDQNHRATSRTSVDERSTNGRGLLPGRADGHARRWKISSRAARPAVVSEVAVDRRFCGTGYGRASISSSEEALTHAISIASVPEGIRASRAPLQLDSSPRAPPKRRHH